MPNKRKQQSTQVLMKKITSFIDTQPTFERRKEAPQKLDSLQPEYDPKDFKIVKGVLKEYKGSSSVVVIPDNVTRIGRYAFSCCKGLTSVTIPDSVTSIGSDAFSGCSGLTSVTIGNSVTRIGDSAFCNCTGLTSITIPDSVMSIDSDAFYGCSGLTSVHILDIAKWCKISFEDSNANPLRHTQNLYVNGVLVKDLIIPDSVTSIGNYAFNGCSGLTSVTIGNSVTSIGKFAFEYCYKLVEVYNKSALSITAGSSSNGYVAYYAKNVYKNEGGSKLTTDENGYVIYTDGDEKILVSYRGTNIELILPSYITEINRYAFSGCERLTSITIPNTIASIGEDVFFGCTGLTSITIPNSVASIGDSAFYDCTGLTSIIIPDSVTSIGSFFFYGCTGLTSITIPANVTSIGSDVFLGTAWYNNQPDGLVYAGKVAYKYKGTMPWYTSIVLKEGTLGIGNNAFWGCEGLTSITIPDSVTIIGAAAFYNCTGLTSITIPDRVTSIGGDAFYNTAWYNNQPDGLVYAGKVAYKYKGTMPSNTSIVLKEGTLGIGDYAFQYCSGLTSVTIPDSVTSIGKFAFWGCEGLTSITIPGRVTSIGAEAFSGCRNLTIYCEAESKPIGWSSDWNPEHRPVVWGVKK